MLLIVDDEKSTRDGLRAALEEKFDVYLAEDPQIERKLAIKTVRVADGRASEVEDRKRRLLPTHLASPVRLLRERRCSAQNAGDTSRRIELLTVDQGSGLNCHGRVRCRHSATDLLSARSSKTSDVSAGTMPYHQ